jgi:hydrogenase expression/formation protein HypC
MQVIESHAGFALCRFRGEPRRIDMVLVGDQPVGTWILAFLDAAREVIDAEQAALVLDALSALDLAMAGEEAGSFDHLFPDLAGREPELPEHLRHLLPKNEGETPDVLPVDQRTF